MFRCDRSGRRGGGVCLYLSQHTFSSYTVSQLDIAVPLIESLWLRISSPTFTFHLVVVYRPGDSTCQTDEQLTETIAANSMLQNLVILGDFNMPTIDWSTYSHPITDSAESRFVDVLLDNNISQLVTEFTRYRANQNPSLLDLILTTDENLISSITHLPPVGISDHSVMMANIQVISHCPSRNYSYTYERVNFACLRRDLSAHSWSNLETVDVGSQWIDFTSTLKRYIRANTNVFTCTRSVSKPWITAGILDQVHHKRRLWRRFVRSRTDDDFALHRKFSNALSQNIAEARRNYENGLLNNPKALFAHVRRTTSSTVSQPVVRGRDGSVSESPQEAAHTLAAHFEDVYTAGAGVWIPPVATPGVTDCLMDVVISPSLVENELRALKPGSSPGPDGITPGILKVCASELCEPLAVIMRTSFRQGVLPRDWLHAAVIAIHKKGDKLDPSNYRPISLTSIVCRAMERILVKNLLPFLLEHDVIPDAQHGFLPGRSVITNLLVSANEWTKLMDQKLPVDVLYLDFSRAFDKVPHHMLLHKLEHFGIRGHLLEWFRAFLTDRTFSVRVGTSYSHPRPVTSGVPQGSVLGPILFLIYTVDLLKSLRSGHGAYADDCKLFGCPLTSGDDLQTDLDTLNRWCSTWGVPLNLAKCGVVHMGHTNPQRSYYIDNNHISTVQAQCDLGVIVTPNLSWSSQTTAAARKANSSLYLLRKTFPQPGSELAKRLYTTYIRPHLEFGIPAWSPALVKDSNLLERTQRAATRWSPQMRHHSYEQRLRHLNLPTLASRRLRSDLIWIYKATHGMLPLSCSALVTLNCDSRLRGHQLKLQKEPFRTSCRQNFFSNRSFEAWNNMPGDVVSAPTIAAFKRRLDKHLSRGAL